MAALGGPSLVRVCCRGAPTKLHVLARSEETVMLRNFALVGLLAGASGTSVELTEKNWNEVVASSGKSAFVKFLAPW